MTRGWPRGGRGRGLRAARLVGGALAALLVASACHDGGADREGPRDAAPVFVLPTLEGTDIALEAQRGKIVIVDFWATWCAPCEVQMPVLEELWREQGGSDLEVIGVSVDTRPAAEVETWVRERGFDYPIALGDQELAMRFGVIGFPTLFVLDRNGGIHTRHTGVLSRRELDAILEDLRSEPGAAG